VIKEVINKFSTIMEDSISRLDIKKGVTLKK